MDVIMEDSPRRNRQEIEQREGDCRDREVGHYGHRSNKLRRRSDATGRLLYVVTRGCKFYKRAVIIMRGL